MSTVSNAEEAVDSLYFVNREDLSHKEAAKLLNETLAYVNTRLKEEGKDYQVMYYGQPHLGTGPEEKPAKINPMYPLDLALVYAGGHIEPIDIIDVVKFEGYDPNIGRLTTGFMAIDSFANDITAKITQHLESKSNPHILISPVSGTKYNVEKLVGHKLEIDPLNYILLDGYRLVYYLDDEKTKPKALSASSLRSSGVMDVGPREFAERLYIYDKSDPAPRFYFDLSKLVQIAKDQFPVAQQGDVADSASYYIQSREPGKI